MSDMLCQRLLPRRCVVSDQEREKERDDRRGDRLSSGKGLKPRPEPTPGKSRSNARDTL